MSPAMAAERREDDMDEGTFRQWAADAAELRRHAAELKDDAPELAEKLDDEGDLLALRATIMQAALAAYRRDTQLDLAGVL